MSLLGLAVGQRLHAADLSPVHRIAEAGSDFIRWGPRWDKVEPILNGGYDWTDTDKVVNLCADLGVGLVFTVAGRDNNNNAYPKEYAAYAKACVQRYAPKVLGYELGNEPNHIIWSRTPTAAGYVGLLKPAYDACKSAVPSAVILTAGLGGAKNDAGDGDAAAFADGMYRAGAKGYFDGLSFHPYNKGTFFDSIQTQSGGGWRMRETHRTMKAYGDGAKQIWVTEVGNPTGGTGPHVSEQEQATILLEGVSWMRRRPWVGPIAWFDHQDDPNPDPANHGDFCGLWRADWSPKPSLAVFSALARAA